MSIDSELMPANLKRLILGIVLAAMSCPGIAEEEHAGVGYKRQESLELPGLTAGCHICEWRPKLNEKPAPEQCGVDTEGNPLVGLFECGFAEDCERVCKFLACEES